MNGFGQLKDGRGNIAPVTIILPTIAMEAKESATQKYGGDVTEDQIVEEFMYLLDHKIYEAIVAENFTNSEHFRTQIQNGNLKSGLNRMNKKPENILQTL